MRNPLEVLGENISKERKRAGLSQQKLADALEVEQGTVSAWERGRIDIPYLTLYRIAGALKTSPATLADPNIPAKKSIEGEKLEAMRLVLAATDSDTLGNALIALGGVSVPPVDKRKSSAV